MSTPESGIPRLSLDLTISIVTWNSAKDIIACLDSLPLAAEELSYSVTVVDNDSSDGTAAIVRETHPDVRLIESGANRGFGAGNNLALREGIGSKHLMLNPDTIALPGCFRTLVSFLDNHPRAAIVGPRIYEKDGTVYPSCRSFPTPGALLFRNRVLSRLFPNNPYTRDYLMAASSHDRVLEVGWLSGSVMMMRAEALQDVGLMDERFFMYCEDMDWCRRAHDRGWEVYYCPDAELVHLRARSTDQRIPAMILEHHRSMWKYYRKHEAQRHSGLWSAGAAAMISLRALMILGHHFASRAAALSQNVRTALSKAAEKAPASGEEARDG